MPFIKVKKEFKLVGLRGSGEFVNFGTEVPLLAKQLLSRSNEILISTEAEIAVFDAKKDDDHRIGHYYVGLMVTNSVTCNYCCYYFCRRTGNDCACWGLLRKINPDY